MTAAAYRTRIACVAAAALLLAGCASPPAAAQPAAQRRSNVVPPSMAMAASQLEVATGSRTVLRAQPHGGEAMLFTVDWKVVEGAAGGVVEAAARNADGSWQATYTAPPGRGTYHVTATIREYPAASATAEIRVR